MAARLRFRTTSVGAPNLQVGKSGTMSDVTSCTSHFLQRGESLSTQAISGSSSHDHTNLPSHQPTNPRKEHRKPSVQRPRMIECMSPVRRLESWLPPRIVPAIDPLSGFYMYLRLCILRSLWSAKPCIAPRAGNYLVALVYK